MNTHDVAGAARDWPGWTSVEWTPQLENPTDQSLYVSEQAARQLSKGADFVLRTGGVEWDLTVLDVGKPDEAGGVTLTVGPRASQGPPDDPVE